MLKAGFLVLALVLGVSTAANARPVWESELKDVRSFVDVNKAIEMPDGFSLSFGFCDDEYCIRRKAQLISEMNGAYKGAYQDQRNLAYCLWDGCRGVVMPNRLVSCAWRFVIAMSGSVRVDDTDMGNLKVCVERLDSFQSLAVRAQASALFRLVYGREMPAVSLPE